ncbi:hypothetical protein pb186bvf_000088 [Paramecium bursaria]
MDFRDWIENKAPTVFFVLINIQLVCFYKYPELLKDIQSDSDLKDNPGRQIDDYYKWVILFVFQISDCYYAWHAILLSNVLELFAFMSIELCTYLATCVRFIGLSKLLVVQLFNYFYLLYSGLVLVLTIICYNRFYETFIYKNIMKVGAALEAQKQYKNYSYFNALLKLYFQISLCSFITFFFFQDYQSYWYYYAMDGFVLIIQLVSFFLGYTGVNQENNNYLYGYAGLISFVQVYILTKTLFFLITTDDENLINKGIDIYTKVIIGVTTIVGIGLVCMDFVFLHRCAQEFGRGMKQTLIRSKLNSQDNELEEELTGTLKQQ